MRVRINGEDGYHVLCDDCDRPAQAGDWHTYLEWNDEHDEPRVRCGTCAPPRKDTEFSVSLGDVLLGIMLNSGESLSGSAMGFAFIDGNAQALLHEAKALVKLLEDTGVNEAGVPADGVA